MSTITGDDARSSSNLSGTHGRSEGSTNLNPQADRRVQMHHSNLAQAKVSRRNLED